MRQPAGSELNSPLRGGGSAPCGPTAAMGHPWHCAPQCPACPALPLAVIGDAQLRACSDPRSSWRPAAPHSHWCTKRKQGMGGCREGCAAGVSWGALGSSSRQPPKLQRDSMRCGWRKQSPAQLWQMDTWRAPKSCTEAQMYLGLLCTGQLCA